MTIGKLKSGSYRIREMYEGRRYSVTVTEKPTKKEAEKLIRKKIEDCNKCIEYYPQMTMEQAANAYIELKKNVISPSTIRGYKNLINRFSESLRNKKIEDITPITIQKEINDYSKEHSPKTVRNYHGFIASVLNTYKPDMVLKTRLSQPIQKELYTPTDSDVKAILNKAKGTRFEVAMTLACCGLRRSEIVALSPEDLNGDILTINKAKVLDENEKWQIKTTKTEAGTRNILIPHDTAELIRKQGYVYKGHPNIIHRQLVAWQKELGLPHFRLHAMRSYYASMLHVNGVPDSYIMYSGGWKSDYTMKKVYRKALRDKNEEMQRIGIDHITGLCDENFRDQFVTNS